MNLTGNTILITGGTSGIGRALAETFHQRGNQVIVAGRRQHLIDEVISLNPGMRGIQLDLQHPSEIDDVAARVREEFPALNVLVSNAGISRQEDLTTDSVNLSDALSIIQVNIISVLQMTAALLPILKQRPNATIVTTTSGLAFVPRNNFPTYCASKAFLHSWLQSLRVQLRNTSVEVLELAPPYVQTELSGPHQATDPNAMPLADYIAEVVQLLDDQSLSHDEILVERVKAERWAERRGNYAQKFAAFNPK